MGRRSGLEPDVITNSASISACEKGHQWAMALQILGKMRRSGLEPDVITNSASISACEKGHQWAMALQILGKMRRSSLEPDVVAVLVSLERLYHCARKGIHAVRVLR